MMKRDPLHLAILAAAALAWVSGVSVCIMGAMYWRYEMAEQWAWLSVWIAGTVMVLTWWIIAAAAERDRETPAKRQSAPVSDAPRIRELPPEGYQSIVRMEYDNWPNIRRDRIHRAIQIVMLDRGRASVRVLKKARLNEGEAAEFRAWLKRNGWGDEYRNSIVLNATGREELEHLSPIARGLHR